MADKTRLLYVQYPRVNVRSTPQVAKDNVVESFIVGDPLEILVTETKQASDDGWVWWRLSDSDAHWVAEYNRQSKIRLLADTPPEIAASAKSQTLYVMVDAVKLRSAPCITAGNAVGLMKKDERLAVLADTRVVGPQGWVWRKLADREEETWTAEYNVRSAFRLLTRQAPKPDPVTGKSGGAVRGRVQVQGRQFLLDGKHFRFLGANLREFPFYVRKDVLPYANEGNRVDQLKAMQRMKMRVMRMRACYRDVSLPDALPLVRQALDIVHEHGLLAIVALNDALGRFWVPGDERFHVHTMGHLDKIEYFHRAGYKENFLPYVKKMVETFKDHPAVFAWELGNEYAIHPQPATPEDGEAFLRFAKDVSDTIRAIDPNHLITTGLVNTGHVAPNDRAGLDRMAYGRKLYGLSNIDFMTVHFYGDNSEEQSSLVDLEIAKQLDMPLIVEEWGTPEGDRTAQTNEKIEFWLASGAAGFMQWGLSATGMNIGVGDNKHGMDPYADGNRDHYHKLFSLYTDWAKRLLDG